MCDTPDSLLTRVFEPQQLLALRHVKSGQIEDRRPPLLFLSWNLPFVNAFDRIADNATQQAMTSPNWPRANCAIPGAGGRLPTY